MLEHQLTVYEEHIIYSPKTDSLVRRESLE